MDVKEQGPSLLTYDLVGKCAYVCVRESGKREADIFVVQTADFGARPCKACFEVSSFGDARGSRRHANTKTSRLHKNRYIVLSFFPSSLLLFLQTKIV